jgi:protease PrsW
MAILTILAVLPGLAISFWIYFKDRYEKEPHGLLLLAFLWGCASTVPAILGQMYFRGLDKAEDLWSIALLSFGVIALTEELSKFIFLRFFAYPKRDFNEPMDGIVYGVMIGMGFATLENFLYVFNSTDDGFAVAVGRALTAVPAHGAFAVLMGAYVGLAKFVPERRNQYLLYGLGLAIFFHGLYDFFLLQQSYAGLGVMSLVALVYSIILSKRLIKNHQDLSPFNKPIAQDEPEMPPPPSTTEGGSGELI